ncbi:MAG: tetratricopeptide repeat protein, partial [Bacteroidota bacterium]
QGEWQENAISYYQINEANLTKRYREEIARVKEALADNQAMMYDSLARLEELYRGALSQAQELAEQFAIANLDDATDVYKEAFEYFKEDKVMEAIELLADARLDQQLKDITEEIAEGKEIIAIGEEKVVNAQEALNQGIENYLLKADLLVLDFRFDEAEENFVKAVEVDTMRVDVRFRYAVFLQKQNRFQQAHTVYQRCLALAHNSYEKSSILNNMGLTLINQNDYQQGMPAYEEALKIYRRLTQNKPEVYLPYFAHTLNNIGVAYKKQDNYQSGMPAFQEALNTYKKLAQNNPELYLPYVPGTLNNIGIAFIDQNDYQRGMSAYQEALKTYRKLAEKNPEVYLPYLATTLNNMGLAFTNQNDYQRGISVYQEALNTYRKFAENNPKVYLPYLATTLNNLGIAYQNQNDYQRVMPAYQEALNTYRKLAENDPEVYLPDVAMTLNNMALAFIDQNDYQRGIPAYQEALNTYRKLAENNPDIYLPYVANSLNNMGNAYKNQNDYQSGMPVYQEALNIRRKLAQNNPKVYLSDLATTLNNMGLAHWQQDSNEVAGRYINEAVRISLGLSRKSLERFGVDAARSMILQGLIYCDLSYPDSAQAAWISADSILRLCPDSYSKQQLQKKLQDLLNSPQEDNPLVLLLEKIEAAKSYEEKDSLQSILVLMMEQVYAADTTDTDLLGYLAQSLGSLSWYKLFTQDYAGAAQAARHGLELNPQATWIHTNLAHALLFQGKYEAAHAIYTKYAPDAPYDEERIWGEVFLADLQELEEAGAIPAERMKDVQKICNLLQP